MQVTDRKLSEIRPYEKNPRRNDDAVDAVANSIREFGWQQPIVVDRDGVIIVGHTRYKAAKKLKLKTVPVVVADLSDEQARAYRIADNSTNGLATWDFDLLLDEIQGLDFDMGDFGMSFIKTDGDIDFDNLEQYKDQEHTEEYDAFLDKFKEKHTTDDCFTPPAVYDAVKEWTFKRFGIDKDCEIVRPFYPGGDYQNYRYPDGCLVLDNPPFSIMKEIVTFYMERGIDFLLFADGRTTGWYMEVANVVIPGTHIVYDNGADVATAFVTNLGDDKVIVSSELYKMLEDAQPKETNTLNTYEYPDNVITSMMLGRLAKYGAEFTIKDLVFVKKMDAGQEIYGGGALISDKQAEKIKVEKEKIKVELSEREREIIRQLGEREVIV